ncbi:MAG TPA: hypothetical protein VNJ08_07020 [Bacteriovoracaceae bacterium]|nr:hypothetical protein [Bacteriovoracaceae bacterium]
MKKIVLVALMLTASLTYASEVTVLEAELPYVKGLVAAGARFAANADRSQGYVNVSVTELTSNDGPDVPTQTMAIIFNKNVKVDGLEIVGDKVMYQGTEGAVECGTLGFTRVFKKPTIYLTGNCKIKADVYRHNGKHTVVAKLRTK